MNGPRAFRIKDCAVAFAAALLVAALAPSTAKADLFSFDSGWGGAAGGALIGGIAGGGRGAAAGVLIGGVVGSARESQKRDRRRAEEAARQRQAEERRRWEQQQQLQQQQLDLQRQQAWQAQQQQNQAGANLVAETQRSLIRLGYNPGAVDGQLGPGTVAAISAYQRDRDLLVTGQPSQPLLVHMVQNGG